MIANETKSLPSVPQSRPYGGDGATSAVPSVRLPGRAPADPLAAPSDRPEVGGRPAKQLASVGPLLVDIKELSRLLARSEASLHRDDSAGRIPAGLKLGSSKRWVYAEVVAWVEAGMPDRRTWQAMRGTRYAGTSAYAGGAGYRYGPSRN